ncbi:MAG: recombinase RecA [Candidatus Lindowbacteria bacterium RIFCSPLOWO2_12_FULL_62_27]|nr:MAG: recombinase RecA [Candidatus Lindowbacteria bacterium RIFCSPLOWO2_02_FULL_62_12]OGH62462.1 MAG: recombinase RecA [Candidatus Lindowbacteria bacterium RIFCSPLOWO2_12_FULL_62_27]
MVEDEKLKVLKATLDSIEKRFGRGSIMRLGDKKAIEVEALPTGILPLDLAIGVDGIPRGRVIEIFGPESSGKTTITLTIIAAIQKTGGIAAFIDAEHALDPIYAAKLGVDVQNLLISQPDTGEQALEITESLVRSSAVDIIVIDSVAALVPQAELEGEMGQQHMGLQARLMSQALRKLTAAIARSKTTCFFINQLREKIGVMFGSPETTPGGRALKFYSSVRLDIRRIEQLKKGAEVVGNRVRIKVVKNKVAPPFRSAEFDLYFGQGVSRAGCAIEAALLQGVVKKSGAWLSYNGEKIGQGREAARLFIEDNAQMLAQIEQEVRRKLREEGAALVNTEAGDNGDSGAEEK